MQQCLNDSFSPVQHSCVNSGFDFVGFHIGMVSFVERPGAF